MNVQFAIDFCCVVRKRSSLLQLHTILICNDYVITLTLILLKTSSDLKICGHSYNLYFYCEI